METLFAVTAPGLERLAADELRTAAVVPEDRAVLTLAGGAAFEGDTAALYRANLLSRTASRVLVRLPAFHAAAFSELRKKAARLPWERFLPPGRALAVRATCRGSKLYHSDAVAERVAAAVGDRLGIASPRVKPAGDDAEDPAQLVLVRIVDDLCEASVDSSGALLHRRGYRLAVAKAPLRETLAAGAILASGWDRASPLFDPFCGSGTIPIEAALLAQGLAPGRNRRFAFMDWPCFDEALWRAVSAEAAIRRAAPAPFIVGSDRDAGAIRAAGENSARAEVDGLVRFAHRAVSAIEPPAGPGWIVTNPPYGRRLGADRDLRDLYTRLGDVLRERCAGWRVTILCSDLYLLRRTRLDLDTALTFSHGGLRVRVGRGVVG
ncbi:MAG: THUMP domain-containing protein [Proteobacteria bacterium]|jgi:putative N6-adenine-specific DNA methylase|nr:THUMP domain-containing protein [Pseudomonadota bacterium]